jgi:hypothetical protein
MGWYLPDTHDGLGGRAVRLFMTTIQALAQSEMLGTRSELTLPAIKQVNIADLDPEAALLASAAVVGIGELGGFKLSNLKANEEVCPGEVKPPVPERAVELLKRVLAGELEVVLPEFLQLIATQDMVVPPETLPTLLGLNKKELHPYIALIGGRRGIWLAGKNPAWAYALDREPQEAWESGSRAERGAALEKVRGEDPRQAREWVQSTWEQDAPDDRAAFVAIFANNLSLEDEQFFERCLDDRRKEIRETARGLLIRLDQSHYVQRMWARASPLIRLRSKFLSGDRLEITLPENPDAAAKRDGIGGQPLQKKMGEKASYLAQMLSLVPPKMWCREFGKTPEQLVAAALNCEWKEPLLTGWELATQRSRDCEWAEALASVWVSQKEGYTALDNESIDEIIMLMRPEKVEVLAATFIAPRSHELDDKNPLIALLTKFCRPWSIKTARMVAQSAQRQSGDYRFSLPQALPGFACWIPPELANELTTGWAVEPVGYWRERINRFLMILNFRNEIRKSLLYMN